MSNALLDAMDQEITQVESISDEKSPEALNHAIKAIILGGIATTDVVNEHETKLEILALTATSLLQRIKKLENKVASLESAE